MKSLEKWSPDPSGASDAPFGPPTSPTMASVGKNFSGRVGPKKTPKCPRATALGEPKGKGPQAGDAKSPTRLVEAYCPVGLKGKAAARAFGPMAPKPGFSCL